MPLRMLDVAKRLFRRPTRKPANSPTKLYAEELLGRDVPAGFTFELPGGVVGTGAFADPTGLDPTAASQTFDVPDLTVGLYYESFSGSQFAATPTAEFVYGELVGVTFSVPELPPAFFQYTGLSVVGGVATVVERSEQWVNSDGSPTYATYDPVAGTGTLEFTLGGQPGYLTYSLDPGAVGPSQYVPLTAQALTLAGRTLTLEAAVNSEAWFQDGQFMGVYAAWSPSAGDDLYPYAYLDIAVSSVAAQLNVVHQVPVVFQKAPRPAGAVVGQGDGLFARYYVGEDFAEVKHAGVEAGELRHNWGQGGPVPAVGTDEFSARWTGQVRAEFTGRYTIYTKADDGVRLWWAGGGPNGVPQIDDWNAHPPTDKEFTVNLTAGEYYAIRLEYFERTLGASIDLSWKCETAAGALIHGRELILKNQLYSNTSTVSGRVWLDAGGNGREDDGEAGAHGVKVRILDGGVDAAPPKFTDANGNYSFTVPAGRQYRVQFGGGDSQYVFTQQLPGDPEKDSDADTITEPFTGRVAGMTALFDAPAAGGSLSNLDAGLSAWFDLDVNGNGSLGDAVDGAAGYLPGYEGSQSKLAVGTTYNEPSYRAQRMQLALEGFGTDITAGGITKIRFEIIEAGGVRQVSRLGGYASNRSHSSIEPANATADYSFHATEDAFAVELTPGAAAPVGEAPMGGRIEGSRAWVNFYAKDYGGSATVRVTVWSLDGNNNEVENRVIDLKIPRDTDNDGIADKWELQMADRWVAQYGGRGYTGVGEPARGRGFTTAEALAFFHPDEDVELADPDGFERGRLVPQADEGDAHTFQEEYRGYVLDGGGLNGQGRNGHAGGHLRLDPARKEILVEVDRGTVLNNLPTTLRAIMDGASSVFSNADRGAGIYMYYLFDQTLPIAKADVDEVGGGELITKLRETRSTALQSDFLHLLFVDEGISAATRGSPGANAGRRHTMDLPVGDRVRSRGSAVGTTDLHLQPVLNATDFPNRPELLMTITAHELVHQLIEPVRINPDAGDVPPPGGAFNMAEHTIGDLNLRDGPDDADDRASLMGGGPHRRRFELATVKFFPLVLAELAAATGEWGTL